MQKSITTLSFLLIVALYFSIFTAQHARAEGALYCAARHLLAIPVCLVNVVKGPEHFATGHHVITGACCAPYVAAAPTACVPPPPAYVTYNATCVKETEMTAHETFVHRHDPLPFAR